MSRPATPTKLSRLREAAKAGDWTRALAIAARFQDLGDEKEAIQRAHNARLRASFYRQIGKDPDGLFAEGIKALKKRYQLT